MRRRESDDAILSINNDESGLRIKRGYRHGVLLKGDLRRENLISRHLRRASIKKTKR